MKNCTQLATLIALVCAPGAALAAGPPASDLDSGAFLSVEASTVAVKAGVGRRVALLPAAAQTTFSFDFGGPMNGRLDCFGFGPIFEGDVVTVGDPGGPGPNSPTIGPGLCTPGLQIRADLHPRILGLVAAPNPPWRQEGIIELDALSYGRDHGERLRFSVDEFAEGRPALSHNDVYLEGALGAREAAADVFEYRGKALPTPAGLMPILFGNVQFGDGDGSSMPGFGLQEPLPPIPGLPNPGDNLDALDFGTRGGDLGGPVYFSLDASFPDPIAGVPSNSGSAAANGFVGGDVLVVHSTNPPFTAVPVVYASANALGLDLVAGPDSDDLDALSLVDDGDGVFEPQDGTDRILFSVRRFSAVVGMPDSRLGRPITPGDILTLPHPGGASPFPAIYIPAEKLGLKTNRSGSFCGAGLPGPGNGGAGENVCDDLDALDVYRGSDWDSDEDGFADDVDNCVYVQNASQLDSDADGIGNACDADIASTSFVVNAGFEAFAVGSPPPVGPAADRPSEIESNLDVVVATAATVAGPALSSGKFLRLMENPGEAPNLVFDTGVAFDSGRYRVSMDLLFETLENYTIYIRNGDGSGLAPNSQSIANIRFTSSSGVWFESLGGISTASYAAGTPVVLEAVFDLDRDTWDAWIDGVQIVDDTAIEDGYFGRVIAGFAFTSYTMGPGFDGVMQLDNVQYGPANDCRVNAADLGRLREAFFTSPGGAGWNPDADFNGDGVVNSIDLGYIKSSFFEVPGPSGQENACDCT